VYVLEYYHLLLRDRFGNGKVGQLSWSLINKGLHIFILYSDCLYLKHRNCVVCYRLIMMFKDGYFLLYCALTAAQCIVIGPVCGFVCGYVTMITQNCVHWSSPNWVCTVGKGGDHLQLINFCHPAPLGRESAVGLKFLAPTYYSQCAMFASPLSAFFI